MILMFNNLPTFVLFKPEMHCLCICFVSFHINPVSVNDHACMEDKKKECQKVAVEGTLSLLSKPHYSFNNLS